MQINAQDTAKIDLFKSMYVSPDVLVDYFKNRFPHASTTHEVVPEPVPVPDFALNANTSINLNECNICIPPLVRQNTLPAQTQSFRDCFLHSSIRSGTRLLLVNCMKYFDYLKSQTNVSTTTLSTDFKDIDNLNDVYNLFETTGGNYNDVMDKLYIFIYTTLDKELREAYGAEMTTGYKTLSVIEYIIRMLNEAKSCSFTDQGLLFEDILKKTCIPNIYQSIRAISEGPDEECRSFKKTDIINQIKLDISMNLYPILAINANTEWFKIFKRLNDNVTDCALIMFDLINYNNQAALQNQDYANYLSGYATSLQCEYNLDNSISIPNTPETSQSVNVNGHSVVVVGICTDGLFIMNSWGVSWGNKGFAYIPFECLDNAERWRIISFTYGPINIYNQDGSITLINPPQALDYGGTSAILSNAQCRVFGAQHFPIPLQSADITLAQPLPSNFLKSPFKNTRCERKPVKPALGGPGGSRKSKRTTKSKRSKSRKSRKSKSRKSRKSKRTRKSKKLFKPHV
jgi:hypothetical protein